MQDVPSPDCRVTAYVARGQKRLEAPDLDQLQNTRNLGGTSKSMS